MMSKTHIGVGLAVALLAAPATISDVLLALTGGSLGCLFCDVDLGFLSKTDKKLKPGWIIVLVIFLSSFILDSLFFRRILYFTLTKQFWVVPIGVVLFVVQVLLAKHLPHRTYSHSITICVLTTSLIYAFARPIWIYYALSFVSHIVLDLFNRKPITLFYPHKKSFCFNICYANGIANTVLMFVSVAACAILLFFKGGAGLNGIIHL